MRSTSRTAHLGLTAGLLGVLLFFGIGSASADFTIFTDSGSDPTSIEDTVEAFRDALGPFNPPEFVQGPNLPGRRQIDWDAAPGFISDPNSFPGDFFNFPAFPRARGIEFSTPGSGFRLSSDPDDAGTDQPAPANFGRDDFQTFSPNRLFTPVGSSIVDVTFFLPGTDVAAGTHGLGVVFTDVEVDGSTSIELFDVDGNSLALETVEVSGDGGLSFLGLLSDDGSVIHSARIISGMAVLNDNGEFVGGDEVVMDDFIFGEPIPEPSSVALVLIGGAGLIAARFRHTRNGSSS